MTDNATQNNGRELCRGGKVEGESQVTLNKEEIIEILKTIEGIKRKLLNVIKA